MSGLLWPADLPHMNETARALTIPRALTIQNDKVDVQGKKDNRLTVLPEKMDF